MFQNKLFQDIKKFIKTFFGVPLSIISFYFVGSILYQNRSVVFEQLREANILLLILGVLCVSVFFIIKASLWKKLLTLNGFDTPTPFTLFSYQFSELKRYTPGNIFSFIARISSFETVKVPKKITLKLIFIETLLLILSSLVASIPAYFLFSKVLSNYISPYVMFTILLVALGVSIVFISRIKHIKTILPQLLTYIDVFFLLIFSWILFGIGNFFIALALFPMPLKDFLPIVSFFILSWFLGYISFITPMGLGIREVIITAGLSILIPTPLASAIAIVQRVMFIAAELITLGVFAITYKVKTAQKCLLFIQKNIYETVLFLLILLYTIYFSFFTFEKHANFFTGRFDLGNMDQTVWNTLHGRVFMYTNPDGLGLTSRLSAHADFILVLLSPFYLLWNDARMLLFIQTVVIVSGAYFVYKIALEILHNKNLSLMFSLSYLFNPFIQKQNLYDFHSVTLATTFLLGCFFFLMKNKIVPFLVFLVLALLTKEHVYLIGMLLFIFIFLKTKNKYFLVGAASLFIMFYLLVSVIIPNSRGGEHFALSYYQDLGDSPSKIAKSLILRPDKTIPLLVSEQNLEYIKTLLFPVGFLSLFSPLYLIFSLPDLLINLLSSNKNFRSINFHYGATILPFIYISAIYGIDVLQKKFTNKKISHLLVYVLLVFGLLGAYLYGPLPGSRYPALEIYTRKLDHRDEFHKFLLAISEEKTVAATNNVGAHLTHRQNLYTIPTGLEQADIIVFLLNDVYAQPSLTAQKEITEKLSKNPSYRKVFEKDSFVAFERIR